MITIETVKQTIARSGFPDALKDRLATVLPLLGKQTLAGLDREVSRGDSRMIAERITTLWESFGKILNGLKQHDVSAKDDFLKLFAETQASLNEESKIYVLNLVQNVHSLAVAEKSAGFSEAELWDMVEYEISLLRYLSTEEIYFLLEHYLLEALTRTNLLKELQIAAVDGEWYDNSRVFKTFSDILLRNREIISAKAVAEWLQEFIKFHGIPLSQKSTLQIAEFLVKQPLASSLKQEERHLLSEILTLFLWCLNPKMDETALGKYRREVEEQRREYFEKIFAMSQSGDEASIPKYFWPARETATVSNGLAYIRKEKLVVPPVVERKAFTTGQAPVAPRPPAPQARGATSPQTPPQPSPRQERGVGRVLPVPPRPPRPPEISKGNFGGQAAEKPSTSPLPPPLHLPLGQGEKIREARGGGYNAPQPPLTLRGGEGELSNNEELYRKTLEELRKLRQQEFREGKVEPPAINEQLIQAGAKGKILGDEAGQMGAGKPDEQKPPAEKPKGPDRPIS